MKKTEKADAVIIGSGLGGMLCGLLLAREGYQTVILERMTYPGGRYTTRERNGYRINTGSWAVGLHGADGPLWKLLTELGIKVETRVPQPVHAHLWVQGKDIPLPPRGQLRTIIEAVSKNKNEAERVLAATRNGLFWQEPSDEMTCEEWLRQYTDNPLIHDQFNFFTRAMTGTYYDVFPAGEYFRILRGFGQCGSLTAMPKNGQKTTMDAMVNQLKKWKGDLQLETKVEQIISPSGKVEGVVAMGPGGDRIEIDTPVVISDAGPEETVRLLGATSLDQGYLSQIAKLSPTMAVVTIFGYDKPMLNYESHVQFIETDRLGTAWEPCHIWPDYAPPGKNVLYTYSTMKTDNTKKELPIIIEQCKTQFPALEKAEIIATLVFKKEWPVLRARPTRCLPIRTPILGLYLAGDAVNVSGWTCGEGISFSSRAIAESIKTRFPHK